MISALRKIIVTEAKVKTATIEIKTLTLNGKQVTLSVFRQLQETNIINWDTGELNGQAWGKVNYFWGECKSDHLHVVWQDDAELRRDCVYSNIPGWKRREMNVQDEACQDRLAEATAFMLILKHFASGQESHFGNWVMKNQFVDAEPYTFNWILADKKNLPVSLSRSLSFVKIFSAWATRGESFAWKKQTVTEYQQMTDKEIAEEKRVRKYSDGKKLVPRNETDEEYANRLKACEVELFSNLESKLVQIAEKMSYTFPILEYHPALLHARQLVKELLAFRMDHNHFYDTYSKSYHALMSLDQLFIAV